MDYQVHDNGVPGSTDTIDLINKYKWFHRIPLPGGIVTPGDITPSKTILSMMDTIDFTGKSVLDIGCWDGFWSFEAERRGATTVFATDDVTQRPVRNQPTFSIASGLKKSHAIYRPNISVYDIDTLEKKDFDIVLYFGVYYHLKHPLLAFSKLRRICKDGAILLTEGPAFGSRTNSFAKFYYRQWWVGDRSNWWVPSIKCLKEMIECSYFKVSNDVRLSDHKFNFFPMPALRGALTGALGIPQRYVVKAQAVTRADVNYVFPDTDLREFDANDYGSDSVCPGITREHLGFIDRMMAGQIKGSDSN
jgi:tRNA (mo5U34)-methyltransferase